MFRSVLKIVCCQWEDSKHFVLWKWVFLLSKLPEQHFDRTDSLTVKASRTSFQATKRVDVFIKMITFTQFRILNTFNINQNTAYYWIWNLHITTLLTYVACYHPVISAVPFLNPKARVETNFKLYSLFLSLAVPCNWDVRERGRGLYKMNWRAACCWLLAVNSSWRGFHLVAVLCLFDAWSACASSVSRL